MLRRRLPPTASRGSKNRRGANLVLLAALQILAQTLAGVDTRGWGVCVALKGGGGGPEALENAHSACKVLGPPIRYVIPVHRRQLQAR